MHPPPQAGIIMIALWHHGGSVVSILVRHKFVEHGVPLFIVLRLDLFGGSGYGCYLRMLDRKRLYRDNGSYTTNPGLPNTLLFRSRLLFTRFSRSSSLHYSSLCCFLAQQAQLPVQLRPFQLFRLARLRLAALFLGLQVVMT